LIDACRMYLSAVYFKVPEFACLFQTTKRFDWKLGCNWCRRAENKCSVRRTTWSTIH
jgi:hypothetical protein